MTDDDDEVAPRAVPQSVLDTAPARVYLDLGEDATDWPAGTRFSELHEVTWSDDNATGQGIEYVRADRSAPLSIAFEPDDVVVIEGIRYAGVFFRELASFLPIGQVFSVESRADGVLTITRHDISSPARRAEDQP